MDPKEPKPEVKPARAARPDDTRRSLIGQTIADTYRVLGLLGTGGMGSVFEAEHIELGEPVAIKVLHAAHAEDEIARKRFHQEAWATGAIGHPNLCAALDMGTLPDGSPYLVMERLFGETLSERLRREQELPIQDVIVIVRQVLAGLGTAHDHGVLHRDIKPENVFLAEQHGFPTMAKLLDFGVSKVFSSSPAGEWEEKSALTKAGIVMGTPYYLSPEQARALRDLDARADLYACGVMLYELLTGVRPFAAHNYDALLLRILQGNPTPPRALRPSVSPELEEVVLKAMAKERDARYASAPELSQALASVRDRAEAAI